MATKRREKALGFLVVAWACLVGLGGCQRADYSGASFAPEAGPPQESSVFFLAFEPKSPQIPWGDAAFRHRSTRASGSGEPLLFQASLDRGTWLASDPQGELGVNLEAGLHRLRLLVHGRTHLYPLDVGAQTTRVVLISHEGGGELLLGSMQSPKTDLVSWPVSELSMRLPKLRRYLEAFQRALAQGQPETFERLLAEDFRDDFGARRDFLRGAVQAAQRGEPWSWTGDVLADFEASQVRVDLVLLRQGVRRPGLLVLEVDPRGVQGLKAKVFQ